MPANHDEINRLHANVCKGLGDPKRLLIISVLKEGEHTVSEICDELGISQANISQQLRILRTKGLVKSRRDGQWVYYSLSSPKISQAMELMRQVMAEQMGEIVSSSR